MTYENYVLSVLRNHYDDLGLDDQEIEDFIQETPFSKIESFLIKIGYDLTGMYSNDYKIINQINRR
jgi:hypothetical protein